MKPTNWTESANLAIDGIIHAVKTQRHMRYHLVAALAVLFLSLLLDISRSDFILLALAIILVLVTEMLNTAIELTVDMISREYHPQAKAVKDIGAGVVLLASIGALTLAYFIVYPPLRDAVLGGNFTVRPVPADILVFVALAVTVIVVIIAKAMIGKGEPLRGGMPSGHAAVSFSICVAVWFMTASLTARSLALGGALVVSWSRWSAGIHRPAEVAAGALVGAGATLLLFLLFR